MADATTMADLLDRAEDANVSGLTLGKLWPAGGGAAPAMVTLGVWMWATALGACRETPGWLIRIRQRRLPAGGSEVLCQALITATIDEQLGIDGTAVRGYLAGEVEHLAQAERQAVLAVMATLMERHKQ